MTITTNTNESRRVLYMTVHGLHPDEMEQRLQRFRKGQDPRIGATNLECENDLRGITGDGSYAIPGYCSQLTVSRCSECSLCNYGMDCHNHPVA